MLALPGVEVLVVWNGGDLPVITSADAAAIYDAAGETDCDTLCAMVAGPHCDGHGRRPIK